MVFLAFQANKRDSCRLPNGSLVLKHVFKVIPSVKPSSPMAFLCSAMLEPIADRHRPWAETREEFATRLRQAAQKVNDNYEVADLCREFPNRLDDLVNKRGDKLMK